MAWRQIHLVALLTVTLLAVGCGGRSQPLAPVALPRLGETDTVQQAEPAAPAPAQSAVTAPAQPVPAQAAPSPVSQTVPDLLKQVLAANWQLAAIQGLPPLEQPRDRLIYEGGALRLYKDGDEASLYGFVVNHTLPAYAAFATLTDGPGYAVGHDGKYTGVLRVQPVSDAELAELQSRTWTEQEIAARFGEPTWRVHQHGIGTYIVTYVTRALEFEDSGQWKLLPQDAAKFRAQQAQWLAEAQTHTDALLAKGKPSPDGRRVAAHQDGGGYWLQSLVVREQGKAEVWYHVEYFLEDFAWVDNRRLAYILMPVALAPQVNIIDVVAGKELQPIKLDPKAQKMGFAGPGKVWYTTEDGVRHELSIP